jgi:hypothetical protein
MRTNLWRRNWISFEQIAWENDLSDLVLWVEMCALPVTDVCQAER